ncbi:MAG: transporter associated domain-containing protein, partial [Candidatus Kryptoniota bacterium]
RLLSGTVSSGTLDRVESELVKRLLENSQTSVKTIMVPRTSLVGMDIESDMDLLMKTFEKCGKSKILIYENNIDNVVGVVHINDVFSGADSLRDLIRDVLFIPETISITDLMQQFKRYGIYVSVVVDEFGGTAGLVTSSDVMQSFIGEAAVPEEERKVKEISSGTYLLQGSTDITEVENTLGVELPKGDYLTIGGLLESQLGRVPVDGEKVKIGPVDFVVLKADRRKVLTVKVSLKHMNQN